MAHQILDRMISVEYYSHAAGSIMPVICYKYQNSQGSRFHFPVSPGWNIIKRTIPRQNRAFWVTLSDQTEYGKG